MPSDDDLLNDDDSQQLLSPAHSRLAGSAARRLADRMDAGGLAALLAAGGAAAELPPASNAASAVISKLQPPKPSASRRAEQLLERVESGIELALREDRRDRSRSMPDVSGATPFQFSEFASPSGSDAGGERLDRLDDVELDLQIELGRAELPLDEVHSLRDGAVVPLDKFASDPVDIVINGRLFARGEVLVLNDNFCVRVAEIVMSDF